MSVLKIKVGFWGQCSQSFPKNIDMFECAIIENSVAVLRENVGRFFHAFFLKKYKMLHFYIHVFKPHLTRVIPS